MRSDRGHWVDGHDFSAGPLQRTSAPLRRWHLWAPVVVMALVFALAVVRW
jgi:hypothetical protein